MPELGCAEMDLVDREKVHVLYMPCECRAPHSKVQVQCVGARQIVPLDGKKRDSAEGECATFHIIISSVNKKLLEVASQLNIDID